ncbi:MAG TPA: hypothetical protein VGS19_31475, partial [Streptosporangiaceae bacterium]|nr:hypothetical protein [Streptosporangiaceae bacterium]
YYTMPAWYVEGVPTWAMNTLGNGSDKESSFWLQYLDTPGTSVFARSYAALGFFVHLAETGTDVWQKVLPMGEAIIKGGNAAGWAAAAPGNAFLDSWGPGYAEGRYPGAAWQTGAPNLPHYEGPIPQMSLGDGHTITVRSPAVAVAIAHVDINAQVVQFGGTGNGRFSLDNGTDTTLADAAGTVYTTTAGQARCPAGSADAGASLTPINSGMHYIGLTGGLSAAAVTVQGLSLKSYCGTRRTSCLVGNWVSTHEEATAPGVFSEGGGAGVRMRIGPHGAFDVEFGGMAPIDFTSDLGSTGPVAGAFTFSGRVTGRAKLPPGGPDVIQWAPVPSSLNYSSLAATVHLTSPIDTTVGPMNIASLASSMGAGSGAISSHPFSSGTFTCTDNGNTLISTTPSGMKATGSWTFRRR